MNDIYPASPEWRVSRWFNSEAPLSLGALRRKVVMVSAFQMLCPGCVSESLPQALRVREAFSEGDLAVVGLHTVFEHHEAMTPTSLAAFLHEYRITIPVGVDEANPGRSHPSDHAGLRDARNAHDIVVRPQRPAPQNVFGHIDFRLAADHGRRMRRISQLDRRPPLKVVCTPEDCSDQTT